MHLRGIATECYAWQSQRNWIGLYCFKFFLVRLSAWFYCVCVYCIEMPGMLPLPHSTMRMRTWSRRATAGCVRLLARQTTWILQALYTCIQWNEKLQPTFKGLCIQSKCLVATVLWSVQQKALLLSKPNKPNLYMGSCRYPAAQRKSHILRCLTKFASTARSTIFRKR